MTYVDTTQRDDYTATSGQTVFAYTFRILAKTDLLVYDDGTLKTLTTHYTVSGVGDAGGGNVTFLAGVTLNNPVIIIRDTPDTQNTDYTPSGEFPSASHETALDKLAMKSQDIEEKLTRAIKFVVTSALNSIDAPEGSSATDRGGKVWAWDSAGTGLELLTATVIDAVSVIAVKGDIAQGDSSGGAAKLAIGSTGGMLHVLSGLLAYLGIGSTNDTLQVVSGQPAWVANPAIPGKWDLISSQTASNDALINFTGLTSAYSSYRLVISEMLGATDAATPICRISTSGTFNTGGSDYDWGIQQGFGTTGDTNSNGSGDVADSSITIGSSTGTGTNETLSGTYIINNLSDASIFTSIGGSNGGKNSAGSAVTSNAFGRYLTAEANDGIQLRLTAGNITSGTLNLYGLRA